MDYVSFNSSWVAKIWIKWSGPGDKWKVMIGPVMYYVGSYEDAFFHMTYYKEFGV